MPMCCRPRSGQSRTKSRRQTHDNHIHEGASNHINSNHQSIHHDVDSGGNRVNRSARRSPSSSQSSNSSSCHSDNNSSNITKKQAERAIHAPCGRRAPRVSSMDVRHYKRHHRFLVTTKKRSFAVVPNEFVVPARVQVQRVMPVWMAKVRWLVLRGSKTPILAVYRQVSAFVMDENPLRVMLLGADTRVHVVGEKGMVIVSSRVRRNDTWAMSFESSGQRKRMYELVKMWIELSGFLQGLTGFESVAKSNSSVVYRAHALEDPRRQFALKRVNRVKCWNEIEVSARLAGVEPLQRYLAEYEYIFEDSSSRDNSVTIAMRYYGGGSLADRIREFGALNEAIVRSVVASLSMALHLLHQQGVWHLDVKAGNILFDAESASSFRNLKLVDFGSCALHPRDGPEGGGGGGRGAPAQSQPQPQPNDIAAQLSAHMGTYGCMAPERFDGRCGPEADVYGAGVVLFHMVTAEIPFPGHDSYAIMARNLQGDVHFDHPRWRHVSAPLRRLAERMLAKDPAQRITLPEVLALPWLFPTRSSSASRTRTARATTDTATGSSTSHGVSAVSPHVPYELLAHSAPHAVMA